MSGGPVSASRSTSLLCLNFQDFRVQINLIRFQTNLPFLHNILACRNRRSDQKTLILSHRFDNISFQLWVCRAGWNHRAGVRPFGGDVLGQPQMVTRGQGSHAQIQSHRGTRPHPGDYTARMEHSKSSWSPSGSAVNRGGVLRTSPAVTPERCHFTPTVPLAGSSP